MAFLWISCSLTVCLAPGSQGQKMKELDEEHQAAGAQMGDSDIICHPEGCYAVFLEKKTFREARSACSNQGGTSVTMHTRETAGVVHNFMSASGLHGSRTRLRLWIGSHRPPRQCSPTKPLRGFVWITGNQKAQFTNWIRKEMPNTCSVPRCVSMTVHPSDSGGESIENFRWLEGPCTSKSDGFICQYTYTAMCTPSEDEGRGPAVYETPFHVKSTQLTHVPFGSVADSPCPTDSSNPDAPSRESVSCLKRDDGTAGWSKDAPLCSSSTSRHDQDWCSSGHKCEQYCQSMINDYRCYCSEGYIIDEDGYSCKQVPKSQTDPTESSDSAFATDQPRVKRECSDMGCEYDCSITSRSIRCTCPPGYQIGPDGLRCLDVDECRQQPCSQLCVNTPGTFHCTCHPGYQPGSTEECVDIDECLDEGTCEGSCENTEGSFSCLCNHGYVSNSEGHCVDLDECVVYSPCHQQCVNLVGGYQCDCDSGFESKEDGLTCQPSDYDGEYSTSTPDTSDIIYPDIPWPTLDPYIKAEGNLNADWSTDSPQGFTPDISHQSDNHLNQWDPLSPRQYQTAPSPTQKSRTDNNIGDNTHSGGSEPNNRIVIDTPNRSTNGTEETETPQIDLTGDANSKAEVKDGSDDGKRKHDKSWSLVALSVPSCVFSVVMSALGIVYCTSCAVDKSLSFADCYHWVLPTAPPERREGKTHA